MTGDISCLVERGDAIAQINEDLRQIFGIKKELYTSSLSKGRLPFGLNPDITQVYRFATSDLAQILYDNVTWEGSFERADTDWKTAESFINHKKGMPWLLDIAGEALEFKAYELLSIQERLLKPINLDTNAWKGISQYLAILQTLQKLPDTALISLFSQAKKELSQQDMKRFLSRRVWDECYQGSLKDHLPHPPYGIARN